MAQGQLTDAPPNCSSSSGVGVRLEPSAIPSPPSTSAAVQPGQWSVVRRDWHWQVWKWQPAEPSEKTELRRLRPDLNKDFAGVLDEVAVWARALSSQEVQQLYNGGAGQTVWSVEALCDRLLHYFSMDECLEPNAADKYQQAFEITYSQ